MNRNEQKDNSRATVALAFGAANVYVKKGSWEPL